MKLIVVLLIPLFTSSCLVFRPGKTPKVPFNDRVAPETHAKAVIIRAIHKDSKRFYDMDGYPSIFGNAAYNSLASPVKESRLFQNVTFWSSRYPTTWDFELRYVTETVPIGDKKKERFFGALSGLTLYAIPSWQDRDIRMTVELYEGDRRLWSRRYNQSIRGVFWFPFLPFALYPFIPGGPDWVIFATYESISRQAVRDILSDEDIAWDPALADGNEPSGR